MNPDLLTSEGASLFERKVVGQYAVYDNSLLFRSGLFPNRIVNGKPLQVTDQNISSMVKNFSAPVAGNVQHTNYLKGKALHILSMWQSGSELRGTVAVPLWLDENLDESEKRLSVELNPQTFDSVVGCAMCTNPAITDAQLMTIENDWFAKKEAHTTYHGQETLQRIHDAAARSGAICKPGSDDNGKMTSKPESKGIQAIHDLTLDHGASCSSCGMYGYYTDPSPDTYTTIPIADATSHSVALLPATPTITLPTPEKDKKPMKLSDFIALFTGKEKIENDLGDVVMDPSGVVHKLEPVAGTFEKVDVTKSAEFVAEQTKANDLEAKLQAIEDQRLAEFTIANEAAIDALIVAGKYDPKDRATLVEDRKSNPALFDKMVELVPVKAEFAPATSTISPEEAERRLKEGNAPSSLVQTTRETSSIYSL